MRRTPTLAAVLAAVLLASASTVAPARAADAAWVQGALALQQELGDPLPLRNAPWLGTHNSFNSRSEPPTLSGMDNNQVLSLPQQLDLGMRSLEIDAHYVPSPQAGGAKAPVACHGRGASEGHLGCTTERLLADHLREVDGWLAANPGEVLLLYLEDHLESAAGYQAGAEALESTLGPRIHTPPAGGGCTPMPLELTRDAIRAAGKQVLVISSCGPEGTAWPALTFDDADRAEHETGPEAFERYPTCDPGRDRSVLDAHLVRVFEDSTRLSAGVGFVDGDPPHPITPDVTKRLLRCGVDLLGFDQLVVDDPRLEAAVWTWAPGEPLAARGACVIQKTGGRWRTADCRKRHAFACRDAATGEWSVDRRFGRYAKGAKRRCPGAAAFDVPRTAGDARRLRTAIKAAGSKVVWVRLKR